MNLNAALGSPYQNMSSEAKRLANELAVEMGINDRRRNGEMSPDYLEDVVDFHNKFKVQSPTVLEDHQMAHSMQQFKIKHLQEELDEYVKSVNTSDMEGALDALVDLIYVAYGVVHAHDFAGVFPEAWRRVHAANMAKEVATKENASKRGFAFDIVKPKGWTAASLEDLVR